MPRRPGVFRTTRRIGETVSAGEAVATIAGDEDVDLAAPIAGALRGLTRDRVPVARGAKIVEVDPRGPGAEGTGLGERPRRIAAAILTLVDGAPAAR